MPREGEIIFLEYIHRKTTPGLEEIIGGMGGIDTQG
jgi:hypothetical protein